MPSKLQWNDVVEEHRLGGVGREAGCAAELHFHIADKSGVWAQVIVWVRSPARNADGRGNSLGRDGKVDCNASRPSAEAWRERLRHGDGGGWGEVGKKKSGKHKYDATQKSPPHQDHNHLMRAEACGDNVATLAVRRCSNRVRRHRSAGLPA